MPVKINGSTSGSVTLAAPATGSDVTLTLPTLGFGKVLQVVMGTYSAEVVNSTSTYADTGLSATITPSSTSSRILIVVNQAGVGKESGNALSAVILNLLRGSTEISILTHLAGYNGTSSTQFVGNISGVYLDSPSTTSATTYKTQFKNYANAASVKCQVQSSCTSSIVLVEVGP